LTESQLAEMTVAVKVASWEEYSVEKLEISLVCLKVVQLVDWMVD
jgi:hypothetical protein